MELMKLRRHLPWLLPAACVAVVLVSKLAGARFVREARQDAVRVAVLEMRLDLVDRARALEALLRSGRAELEFLASSPPVAGAPLALREAPPGTERFRRLEVEATLLRYLAAHPEIERMFAVDAAGAPIAAAGRRASAPVPIPLEAAAREAPGGRLRFTPPLGDGEGSLVADVNPASLLASLATGTGRAVLLDASGAPLAGTPQAFRKLQDAGALEAGATASRDWISATTILEPAGFEPAVRWTLARAEREEDLLAGLGSVAERYRLTLALDALGLVAVLVLGGLALRLVQRRARLEEQAAQEHRLHALEARLAEADRLASVGRVAATLAHEIRNPLEGMRNWLVLAEDEARTAGSDATLRYTRRVGEGIDHLAEVVRRVLALAKPSQGHVEPADLASIARETIASVESTRPFRGIRIELSVVPAPPVRADRVLLGQLLLNLLLNARDAMPDGGAIRVEVHADGRDVRLRVSDTGRGIAPEMLPRLFEPFVSGRGSSGLGLSLCERIARVHGGRIEARNAGDGAGGAGDAGGAVFTLVLPAEGAEAPAIQELPS